VLHGFLQRIGMHRKGIGTDMIQCRDECGYGLLSQLRQPDVADQQNVGRYIADTEAGRGRFVVEHDPLRAQHHADAELLGSGGQIAVDRPG
jgi:hypothetical protein